MAILRFTGNWIEPITAGRKTQTLRRPQPWLENLTRGQLVDGGCQYGKPPFAKLRILRVDTVNRRDLTRTDARREGLATLEELQDILDAIYGGRVRRLIRIRFEVVKE